MKKLLSGRIAIVVVAVIATVAFFSFKSGDDRNFQIAKNLDIFNAIVKELDMFYVDTIDPNKTIREGIDNMLFTLDPYTEYFPEEDQSELEQMIKGSFGGIGSYIAYNTKLKRSMISEPFEGTPAAKAGLKAGDILMEIDGKDLAGKNNAEPQPAQVIQPVAPQPVPGHAPRYQGGEQIRMFAPEQPSRQSPHQIPRSVQGTQPQQVPHGQAASRPGADGTPAGCQQPVNRPQTIQFHQPVQIPQSQVYDGQWLQPVPSQPQTASTQTVPDNKGESEYGARAQDMGQYGFDKDDEHDRELLREDPYAEYLDFPEEYRMKDEAQMEMICC